MKRYELVVIFIPTLGDNDLIAEASRIKELLSSNGASQVEVENWGKRELGYPVRKNSYGTYTCFFFEADSPDLVGAVQSILRINENVLRYQTQRVVERQRKVRSKVSRLAQSTKSKRDEQLSFETH